MLDHYSQESAVSNSDSSEKASQQNGSSKTNHTQQQFSKKDFQKPKFMVTLQKSILQVFKESTYSQEDSHANPGVKQANKKGLKMKDGFGLFSKKPLGYYDQSTHSLRTYQALLKEEDCTMSLRILPRSGMMQNGTLYRLAPLELPIREKEYLSFPTLTASDSWTDKLKSSQWNGNRHSMRLSQALQLPTLLARDWKGKGRPSQLPTQLLQDGGQLNPTWCEWFMGFPIGHTELNASETQSFLKSRKPSQKQSKRQKNE